MVKALITFPNGTKITIDGTPEEVQSLLDRYGDSIDGGAARIDKTRSRTETKKNAKKKTSSSKPAKSDVTSESLDLTEIVNIVKNCDEAESIDSEVTSDLPLANPQRRMVTLLTQAER